VTSWTSDELAAIGTADELNLQSLRADGELRDPVTIWAVRHGDDLYVRPVKGREGWYRGAQTRHQGHIRAGGVSKDVTFVEADGDPALNDAIDAEFRTKYSSYSASFIEPVVNALARSATIKLVAR
jgi:hypothetical protein